MARFLQIVHDTTRIISATIGFVSVPVGVITRNSIAFVSSIIGMIPIVGNLTVLFILLIISFAWLCFMITIMLFSWLSKIPFVGPLFAVAGMPFALSATVFLNLMHSFARLSDLDDTDAHSYWRKYVICDSYPFSCVFVNINRLVSILVKSDLPDFQETDYDREVIKVYNEIISTCPEGKFLGSWVSEAMIK